MDISIVAAHDFYKYWITTEENLKDKDQYMYAIHHFPSYETILSGQNIYKYNLFSQYYMLYNAPYKKIIPFDLGFGMHKKMPTVNYMDTYSGYTRHGITPGRSLVNIINVIISSTSENIIYAPFITYSQIMNMILRNNCYIGYAIPVLEKYDINKHIIPERRIFLKFTDEKNTAFFDISINIKDIQTMNPIIQKSWEKRIDYFIPPLCNL